MRGIALTDKQRVGVMNVAVSRRNVRMGRRAGAVAIYGDRVDTMWRQLHWTNKDRVFLTRSMS
jgi:hypothetical protein